MTPMTGGAQSAQKEGGVAGTSGKGGAWAATCQRPSRSR